MCRALRVPVSVFPFLSTAFRVNFVTEEIARMKDNQLVEIPFKVLHKLRDLYKDRKTEASAYNMIQNYIEWFEKDPFLDFAKFYSLNGDWSDGTFVLNENNLLMFNTLNDSEDRLLDLLNCLERKTQYFFGGMPNRIRPTVEKYFKQLNVSPSIASTTVWYHISREEALEFETSHPDGISLSPVRQEHVITINSLWPHRAPGSEAFVSRLVSKNLNMGVYDKDGTLLAWIFKLPIGSLGILHVKDEHKRNGYGSLLVRVLSKKFAEMGMEVTAPVVESNVPSREMFKKLNFKEIDTVYWWQKPAIK